MLIVEKRSVWLAKTLVLGLVCLWGTCFSTYLLYLDIMGAGGAGVGAPVAEVEQCGSNVWRKPSTSYMWSHIEPQSALYRRDSVRAGNEGHATIRLENGSRLELGENSLVVLEDTSALALDFIEGSFMLRSEQGDSAITVDETGQTKREIFPVRLIRPGPFEHVHLPTASRLESLTFGWALASLRPNEKLPSSGVALLVSTSPRFTPAATEKVSLGTLEPGKHQLRLGPGLYYWAIRAGQRAEVPLSETRKLLVLASTPLRPVSPAGDKRIVFEHAPAQVVFRWVIPEGATVEDGHHLLEVATDESFEHRVVSIAIEPSALAATLHRLPEGPLYWHLKSRYGKSEVTSPPETFLLYPKGKYALTLSYPADRDRLEALPNLPFEWTFSQPDARFEWDLADGAGHSLHKLASSDPRAEWKSPAVGQYRWRTRALVGGRAVAESPWRTLEIVAPSPLKLLEPANETAIHYWETPAELSFRWEPQVAEARGASYELEISDEARFSHVTVSRKAGEARLSSQALGLGAGHYFWRVRLVDKLGRALKVSPPWSFTYGVYPPLEPAEPLDPAPNGYVNLLETDQAPTLRWKGVESAVGYEVVVQSGKRTFYRGVVTETRVTLKKVPAGEYRWTIRAIDRLRRRGRTPLPSTFTAGFGKRLSAPRVIAPEVQ